MWKPTEELREGDKRYGSFLLHGPELVDLDFNPQGVERGYWQDDAVPTDTGLRTSESGCWCVPGWDANNDCYYTRYVTWNGITHWAPVPEGPHSESVQATT